MTQKPTDLTQLMTAQAVLTACIVQTLNESDDTAQARFLARLELAYAEMRDHPKADTHTLEVLAWVRTLLTGFDFSTGQGKPFLSKH